jgi:8-oxo-dGTP pyrophosphatase MutT (NUDIX family)
VTREVITRAPIRLHFGVYGIHAEGGRVLAVRKTRGPYRGLLDLPGGTPEAGEERDETLARELREETGGRILAAGPFRAFDVLVTRDSVGAPIRFRHTGIWCPVLLTDVDHDLPAHEDVDGLEWVPLRDVTSRKDLSAALMRVIADRGSSFNGRLR